MKNVIFRALATVALALPITLAASTPASASVSGSCHTYWYTNPSRMFSTCDTGSTYVAFKSRIACSNVHTYDGPWQTQPGPFYGSLAACPAGTTATAGTVILRTI